MNLYLIVLASLVVGIQLGFLIFFLVVFSRRYPAAPSSVNPPVSVIVCAHDEEKNLRELVPLLLRQDYPTFEIIVVEDRCNDATYDYLLEVTRNHQKVRMVRVLHLPEHVNGKKYALTLGIKAAAYEWVLLTDADCRPANEGWIKSMAAYASPPHELVIGYSPYERRPGFLNVFIRFEALITAVQCMGLALAGRPYMGTGRNLAYTRSLFLDNKGFHKYLQVTGGDDDLFVNQHARKENTAVALGPDTLTRSAPKGNWKEFFYQKLRHLAAGKHYKWSDRFLLGMVSATWILTWIFVLPFTFFSPFAIYGWSALVFRILLLVVVAHRASRMLGEPFESWKCPLLDFIYAIYYLGTGLVALISKRIRWKI